MHSNVFQCIVSISNNLQANGNPSAAMLEVLDPAQNNTFVDHYIGTPFDLSKIVFIATANTTDTIPAPLLDRMEVIRIPGYTLDEKVNIAAKYIVPRQLQEHGIRKEELEIPESKRPPAIFYFICVFLFLDDSRILIGFAPSPLSLSSL